jgi:hypothetical protein
MFGSDQPQWACEFTPRSVVVVSASRDRRSIASSASARLPEGAIRPGCRESNIADSAAVAQALGQALGQAGFSGSELALVIPDDAVTVRILETESFPSSEAERTSFIRWKLKKNVPFDVGSARVAYQKIGENGVVDILAVLSPDAVTGPYENLVDGLGLHPGLVTSSTIASLNLLEADRDDGLFVKASQRSVVTAILGSGRVRFYRNVAPTDTIESSIYPTVMYYQDKLGGAVGPAAGGAGLNRMILCSDSPEAGDAARAVAGKLGLTVAPLHSTGIDDVFKPALGALHR